jgi:hypothetical protein
VVRLQQLVAQEDLGPEVEFRPESSACPACFLTRRLA